MTIGPILGVLIMMNNYFHDVATALLASSAFVLWVLYRKLGKEPERETALYYLAVYRGTMRLVHIALVWIVLGGIPRTIFYTRFEWANAAGRGQVPALIAKHGLMVILIVGGIRGLLALAKRARILAEQWETPC